MITVSNVKNLNRLPQKSFFLITKYHQKKTHLYAGDIESEKEIIDIITELSLPI